MVLGSPSVLAGPPAPPNVSQWPTGIQDMLTGLLNGSAAAKGSGEESVNATSESFTFDTATIQAAGWEPVQIELMIVDSGATPANSGIAGRVAFSTDGVANADTIFYPISAQGSVFDISALFALAGTMYVRTENAPAGTAKLCYRFVTGRRRSTSA